MDFATVQSELPAAIETLVGIPCQWRTQPRQMVLGAVATLDVLAPSSLGVDDVSWANVGDPDLTHVEATITGYRELTLQVSVWSDKQTLAESARCYLERLRTRLRFPTALETLRGLDLAHVRTEAIVDVDPTEDGRIRSMATMDVRLGYAVSETDEPIPFIEQARIRSEFFRDAAGDPLPDGLQIDVTVDGVP